MIEAIQFQHFRVLERTTLPLSAFNLLLGPNGSGKTTAIRALLAAGETARAVRAGAPHPCWADLASAEAAFTLAVDGAKVRVALQFDVAGHATLDQPAESVASAWLTGIRGYVLDPVALARPCARDAEPVLAEDGGGLPAVLAHLRRVEGERWEQLVGEARRLLPEIHEVIAGETVDGQLAFSVVLAGGKSVRAESLSQGTLVIFGLLAIVFAQTRPTLLCLEEMERGIHPRLLRDVRDLLYRLSFPSDWGESAPAVQVLTTTHSPYVLDLFVDTPEDVVIAEKDEAGTARFRRLDTVPEVREFIASGRLGDLWYSGILGGVP